MHLHSFPMTTDSMSGSVGKTKQSQTNFIVSMEAGKNWKKCNSWGCPNYGKSGEIQVSIGGKEWGVLLLIGIILFFGRRRLWVKLKVISLVVEKLRSRNGHSVLWPLWDKKASKTGGTSTQIVIGKHMSSVQNILHELWRLTSLAIGKV